MDFLEVADVLTLHADQVELYGGEHGVRDLGLLESEGSEGSGDTILYSGRGRGVGGRILPWRGSHESWFRGSRTT